MGWVSQSDVAKACNVSVMTVSRALRDQRGVDPALSTRIKRAARRLGYQPNPMLSALVAHRLTRRPRRDFSVVGFITHHETADVWRQDHVALQTFEGAHRRGAEMGFTIQNFWVPAYERHGSSLSRVLVNRGVRGLLLAPLPSLETKLNLDWPKFSVVAIGYSISSPGFSFVASHHSQSLSLILEQVVKLGYRRPALIFNPWADERTFHQLSGAWYYEMQRWPAKDRLPIWQMTERPSPAEVRAWIARNKPDVIIDTFAPDAPILHGTGLSAPADLGYINTNVKSPTGDIAGIFQNFPSMGASAVERLSILINKGETGAPAVRDGSITFGTWCRGRTVRLSPPA